MLFWWCIYIYKHGSHELEGESLVEIDTRKMVSVRIQTRVTYYRTPGQNRIYFTGIYIDTLRDAFEQCLCIDMYTYVWLLMHVCVFV